MSTCQDSPVVLLVRDQQHRVIITHTHTHTHRVDLLYAVFPIQLFGAALTVPLKISEAYYGTGESYLFTFESATEIKIYPWTGENNYIVKGSADSIRVGCEE